MSSNLPKPFLKWAGGKGQLLEVIIDNSPVVFSRYFEPFLGGGAVFFQLRREGYQGKAFLSDVNEELITTYQVVKEAVEDLITELNSGLYEYDKEVYYNIRSWDRQPEWFDIEPVKKAARMIYLNRSCYNGLYRVNKSNQFNVPFGIYNNPTICDEENLRAVSDALHDVSLSVCDFSEGVKQAEKGDFVYLDPPYQPISDTASFTSYTAGGFDEGEQKRLARVFHNLDQKGVYVLESNSAVDFVRKLYHNDRISIEEVLARRAISCDSEGRGGVYEFLIRNYQDTLQTRLV